MIAIKIENLSKKYVIGHQKQERYTALRDVMMHKMRGIGQRLRHPLSPNREEVETEEFWALKDINLEIEQGDRVGIIGRNGAGKSTLLKVLSRITEPTSGKIHINGRVASLLEVGTGFHPELSGRENIYLNGAILGMHRSEIKRKFDEIVDFSGVEKFLDTPVKRYSSGMYVRLAFAVAAHLEPEILIVDEVLAVGDIQFQKKCLGKMKDVSEQGRTVIFVSHNMAAIQKLCSKAVLLKDGHVVLNGDIGDVVSSYTGSDSSVQEFQPFKIDSLGCEVQNIALNEDDGGVVTPFKPLSITIDIFSENYVTDIGVQIFISKATVDGVLFISNTAQTKNIDTCIKKGRNKFTCLINSFNLCSGDYMLGFGIDRPNVEWYYLNYHTLSFNVQEAMNGAMVTLPVYSHLYLDHSWVVSNEQIK